jgi:hypothetical protein
MENRKHLLGLGGRHRFDDADVWCLIENRGRPVRVEHRWFRPRAPGGGLGKTSYSVDGFLLHGGNPGAKTRLRAMLSRHCSRRSVVPPERRRH